MDENKMKSYVVYDDESEKWIIEVDTEEGRIPVGRTINRELGAFEVCKYDSEKSAIDWLNKRNDKFIYVAK